MANPRRALGLGTLGVCALLGGCGGGGSVSTLPGVTMYSVGGTVSGLTGTLTLQDNGSDTVSIASNGAFQFPSRLAANGTYSVTVAVQPAGQACAVSYGTGSATADVSSVRVSCLSPPASSGVWASMGGAQQVDVAGAYGTQGTPSAQNEPGSREAPSSWTDSAGNLWLFGGYGYDADGNAGMLNDLWVYSPGSREWTWVSGSPTAGAAGSYGLRGVGASGNHPGAREGASAWVDSAGELWLFGGVGLDAQGNPVEFNDLWMFDPGTDLWVWVSGSTSPGDPGSYGSQGIAAPTNLPPARAHAAAWIDTAGVLWLFGGAQYSSSSVSAVFNDLWSYDPSTGEWTWISGEKTPNAAGVYGSLGVAASGNEPGARTGTSAWMDTSGHLWLMGGYGVDANQASGELNDLWMFDVNSRQWTWIAGTATHGALGQYGSLGVSAAGNAPGARDSAVAWTDAAGNFWLFGGYGVDQLGDVDDLADLWMYSPATGRWTWVSGSPVAAASGTYGPFGVASVGYLPGSREEPAGWFDPASGDLWLFGGYGFDAFGNQDDLNDLWVFAP